MKFKLILNLLFITGYLIPQPAMAGWLAFGDLRGHLEPCGCDPRSDLGSVQRLDGYLSRERMLHPNVTVFHLGNDFTAMAGDSNRRKNEAIASAIPLLKPSASLMNRAELLKLYKDLPPLPYVLSNYKGDATKLLHTKVVRPIEGTTVVGFVEPFSGFHQLEPFSDAWLKKIKSAVASAKHVTLLFSGSRTTLKRIAKSGLFQTIIASSFVKDHVEFGDEERRNETLLIALRDGKTEILSVPVGGQGVIRSPDLQTVVPAKPVSAILEGLSSSTSPGPLGTSATPSTTKNVIPTTRTLVAWLTNQEDVGVSVEMQKVISQYRNASSAAMNDLIKQRMADLATSSLVGSESCQTCHATAYKKWQESKHAHAFSTITKTSRDSDPECVSCHVVGFKDKGGFVSAAASPHLKDVQCESCHGPRKAHIENPGLKTPLKTKAADSCATCHTPPHSPGFNAKEYWQRIEHK